MKRLSITFFCGSNAPHCDVWRCAIVPPHTHPHRQPLKKHTLHPQTAFNMPDLALSSLKVTQHYEPYLSKHLMHECMLKCLEIKVTARLKKWNIANTLTTYGQSNFIWLSSKKKNVYFLLIFIWSFIHNGCLCGRTYWNKYWKLFFS